MIKKCQVCNMDYTARGNSLTCSPSCSATYTRARKRIYKQSYRITHAEKIRDDKRRRKVSGENMRLWRQKCIDVGNMCQQCGIICDPDAPPNTPTKLTMDHIYPMSWWTNRRQDLPPYMLARGPTHIDNLQVLCHACNVRKQDHAEAMP